MLMAMMIFLFVLTDSIAIQILSVFGMAIYIFDKLSPHFVE